MRRLLASLRALRPQCTPGDYALVLDFDGTVSPIAPTPGAARIDPRCRTALATLATRLPLVAVISGRPAADVAQKVGVAGVVYVGNHGLERLPRGAHPEVPGAGQDLLADRVSGPQDPKVAASASLMNSILERLAARLNLPGVFLERKGLSASIHYRSSPTPAQAREAILTAVQEVTGGLPIQTQEGRMVVDLLPTLATDKGTALQGLLAEVRPNGALYLGDDRTDLAAFAALRRWAGQEKKWSLAIAVVDDETPPEVAREADYIVSGVPEVARFLTWLARLPRS